MRKICSHQGERGVEDRDEDVSHRQVEDEQAGGGLGALVFHHHMAHQRVPEQRHHDDEGVGGHEQRLHPAVLRLLPAARPVGQGAPALQQTLVKVQEEEARGGGGGGVAVPGLSRQVEPSLRAGEQHVLVVQEERGVVDEKSASSCGAEPKHRREPNPRPSHGLPSVPGPRFVLWVAVSCVRSELSWAELPPASATSCCVGSSSAARARLVRFL